jgi:predicted enzyme related to lactoylglutathione lyase
MLANAPITTVLPVVDLPRACDFYENKLGLKPRGLEADGKFVFVAGGGALIALIPKQGGTKAEHTALSFEVADIEDEVSSLERKGVVFEDYDLPNLRTVNHVGILGAEKAAWFKDSEGNYLCIHESLTTH